MLRPESYFSVENCQVFRRMTPRHWCSNHYTFLHLSINWIPLEMQGELQGIEVRELKIKLIWWRIRDCLVSGKSREKFELCHKSSNYWKTFPK